MNKEWSDLIANPGQSFSARMRRAPAKGASEWRARSQVEVNVATYHVSGKLQIEPTAGVNAWKLR